MNARTKKMISTSLPQDELAALDRVRGEMPRAQAVREAIRWYVGWIGRLPPAGDALPDEAEAIERAREEFARGEYVRLEDLQHELGLPTE